VALVLAVEAGKSKSVVDGIPHGVGGCLR
jgi:hypothetical protein